MGEVIVFKAEKDGTHLRPPPEGSAKIVFFTGVWHEPMNDRGGKKRRASGLGEASAVTVKACNGLTASGKTGKFEVLPFQPTHKADACCNAPAVSRAR
jgi:hypothetical protein